MASVYITTPIYYVNGPPHLGHTYTTIVADALARWHRLAGDDVRFQTGTDEHGQKIEKTAKAMNITPIALADLNSGAFRTAWDRLDITYDDFIRTIEPRHKAVVADVWRRMEAAGDIYLGQYEGWYSVGDEAYFAEADLVDGRAPSGHAVQWVVEPSLFFRLSRYAPALLEHYKTHPEMIRPASRANEVIRFVEQGLQDISISRKNFTWGIDVPGHEGHVIYVWIDALTNYISALGGPGTGEYDKRWPGVTHVMGKDIIRFHAIYWPAILMSAGLPLPERLLVHGWWMVDGQKMGKSFGNATDPDSLSAFAGQDALRYFLLREGTFSSDSSFSERAFSDRVNGDLANDYGNLASRTLGMLGKYASGVVPRRGTTERDDDALRAAFEGTRSELIRAMNELQLQRGLVAIWDLVRVANKYVDSTAPWVLARDPERTSRLDEVLYNLCETLRLVAIFTLPFLPQKAAILLDRLGVPASERSLGHTVSWGGLASGTQTTSGEGLFPRLERVVEAVVEAALGEVPAVAKAKRVAPTSVAAPAAASTPGPTPEAASGAPPANVNFEDFSRMALRAARVVSAERHPNADRLLVVKLDVGEGALRTVCAGIAEAYSPEEIIGRTVVLLANLESRKIRGILSQGMLLAAGSGASLRLVTVPDDPAPGTTIG
ncbi:MAG: methionine--tRNA ligase [Myxococcales bacterium]|nr:methionine--tRNA ligase [Myxococcales bacterium]